MKGVYVGNGGGNELLSLSEPTSALRSMLEGTTRKKSELVIR